MSMKWLAVVMLHAGAAIAAPVIVPRHTAEPPRVPPGLNGGYSLETKPSVRIDARYGVAVTAPGVKAREWILFVPRPPDLSSQRILGTQTIPASEVFAEKSPLGRPVHRTRIPVTRRELVSAVRLDAETRALLYSRKLLRGKDRMPGEPVLLSEKERGLFLRNTSQFATASPVLWTWMDSQGLRRGEAEGEVDFARRVFQCIVGNFQYEYLGEQDRSAPHVCATRKSDCGGLAVLFATVLRSQGIPARTLAGRWASSADPNEKIGDLLYHQEHIKAEFFAQGVGWVPADLSSAILHDKTPGKLEHFGNDPGLFLTLHVDNDLMIDTQHFGVRPMPLLQRASYWVRGTGGIKDSTMKETWTVTRQAPAAGG